MFKNNFDTSDKIALFALIPLIILIYLYMHFKPDSTLVLVFVTLIIGVCSVFNKEISSFLFGPNLKCDIQKISTGEKNINNYYNLVIENIGHSVALNIRAKIRDININEWISLRTPLSTAQSKTYKDPERQIYIKRLSPGEEDSFTIGKITNYPEIIDKINKKTIGPDIFRVLSDIRPSNQKLKVEKNVESYYMVQVVSDNSKIIKKKIFIKNNGFDDCDIFLENK